MPDPLRLAVVADPAKVVQQPAVPVGFQLVEVRCPPPGQHRRVEPGLQRRRAARHHLPQPVRLRLPVTGVMRGAAAAPVPGGLPGRGEPARLVHRPRVRRRVGERLHRHQPDPERRQVVAGQPPQHRAQRPRRRVRQPCRGRQHAQPLIAAHPLQPRPALLLVPPQVRITDRDPPRRRPERAQHHRDPAGLRDVPQHPARRRRSQAVVPGHQLVVPPGLRLADQADLQLKALISHTAHIPRTKRTVQPAAYSQLTAHHYLL